MPEAILRPSHAKKLMDGLFVELLKGMIGRVGSRLLAKHPPRATQRLPSPDSVSCWT